jgi:type I restriction enzyme, S subunit
VTRAPWPMVPLGDVLRHVPRPVAVTTEQAYREIGIRSHGRGIFHKPTTTGADIGDKRVFSLEPGDFVLNIVFAWEGAVAVVGDAEAGMIASHRFPTFRPDSDRLDVRYLVPYFRTPPGLELLGRVSPGGAGRNRTLNRAAFLNQSIPLPPLPEQRRIVAKLDQLSAKMDEAQQLRASADRTTQLLWNQIATQAIDVATAMSPTEPLGALVSVRGGGTPSKADPTYWDGSVPWISPKDMKKRALSDAIDHISERATTETAAKLLDPGAVLIVVRGMILAHTLPSAVLLTPAAINQDMKALIPHRGLLPEFLCAVLWAWNSRVLRLVEKSTHDTRRLATEKLLSLAIPVPSITVQRRVLARLGTLETTASRHAATKTPVRRELDALMPAILDRAFKGEL